MCQLEGSNLLMRGGSISSGRRRRVSLTFSRTSRAAKSTSVFQLKSREILELSSLDEERTDLTLLMVASTFSSGLVTWRSTMSGAAPS